MIIYEKIKKLHIELTTRCNSVCPDCPRNLRGVEVIDNFPLCQLSLEQIKKILPRDFLQQIKIVLINGNYGDFIAAKDALPIVQYIKQANSSIKIIISTNASAQPKIWKHLGELGITVLFRLDGLSDTHHLYRQNTDWNLILENAKDFIKSGGRAIWAMIVFDHNQHQIEACRHLSQELGFYGFELIDGGPGKRNIFPVFTKDRKFSHVVGDFRGPREWQQIYQGYLESRATPENELDYVIDQKKIYCKAIENDEHEIYIAANGEIYPCCWTGFYPLHNQHNWTNVQLQPMIKENNALEYGIRHAIQWFDQIEKTWMKDSVKSGRIMACNNNCGRDQ